MLNKKIILDTNSVLRFIIGDNVEKCQKVSDLIDSHDCIVPIEVIAESVYNLDNFYLHNRQLIAEEIKDFIGIKENLVFEEHIVRCGCNYFASSSLDFIDCLLIGYAIIKGNPIFSFDDSLNKKLEHNAFNQS